MPYATFDAFKNIFSMLHGEEKTNKPYEGFISRKIRTSSHVDPFFQHTVSSIVDLKKVLCIETATIRETATAILENESDCALIHDVDSQIAGIITDADFRNRVVLSNIHVNEAVSKIMSTPVISIESHKKIYEAYLLMLERNISHLAVTDAMGQVSGILTEHQIIKNQGGSPYLLIQKIKQARSHEELAGIHDRIPEIMLDPINSGTQPETLTQLVTMFTDVILHKIIEFALEKHGPPPCPFAFMVMGSEGREEQTLKTDQDNAIVYSDLEGERETEQARRYFLDLATDICTWLDQAGFTFCTGDSMAKNPLWCQPLSAWKKYFFDWIHAAKPENLLYSSIFLDFRHAWGDKSLTDELTDYLYTSVNGYAGFFRNMVENALNFRPPLGFFKNIVVKGKGEHKDSFDIKKAMTPIVDFARIYALKHGIKKINTLSRLSSLHETNHMGSDEYEDIAQSYRYMMHLRYFVQVAAMTEKIGKPDNFINPKYLSQIDSSMLKAIFKRINEMQDKMVTEFIGVM